MHLKSLLYKLVDIYNRPLRGVGKVTYDKIAAFLDEDPSIANAIDKSKDLLRIDIFENLLKLKDTVLKYRDLLEKQDIQVLFNNYLTEVGYFEYLTEKLEDEDKIQATEALYSDKPCHTNHAPSSTQTAYPLSIPITHVQNHGKKTTRPSGVALISKRLFMQTCPYKCLQAACMNTSGL